MTYVPYSEDTVVGHGREGGVLRVRLADHLGEERIYSEQV